MIEREISADISSFQVPMIGPLTARQTVCLVVAAPCCWAVYHYIGPYVTRDIAGFLLMIPAVPAALLGWYRPFGLPFEKYLRSVFVYRILAPRRRKYKIVNCTQEALKILEGNDTKPKKKKKTKYKISKEAVR